MQEGFIDCAGGKRDRMDRPAYNASLSTKGHASKTEESYSSVEAPPVGNYPRRALQDLCAERSRAIQTAQGANLAMDA